MTRNNYRASLTAMTDADLVTHAISVYLTARRSRGRDAYANGYLCIDEFQRREGCNGPLWLSVLSGVRAEEEKVREGNRRAGGAQLGARQEGVTR